MLIETTLGHIKVIRNCCGKIITKCLEFLETSDNGVMQWYILKKDKNSYVQEYSVNYIEAGFDTSNPEQKPTIGLTKAKRVA